MVLVGVLVGVEVNQVPVGVMLAVLVGVSVAVLATRGLTVKGAPKELLGSVNE